MEVKVALGHWTVSSSTSRVGLWSSSCAAAGIHETSKETETSRKTAKIDFLIVILQFELRDTEPTSAGHRRAGVYSTAESREIISMGTSNAGRLVRRMKLCFAARRTPVMPL